MFGQKTSAAILAAMLGSALGAVGCGEPQDPLARDRDALLRETKAPLQPGWPAEATILIGEPLLRTQLETALLGAIEDARPFLKLRSQFGELQVKPSLVVEGLTFAPTDACADCVAVTAKIGGNIAANLAGGAFSDFGLAAPYTGEATATVEVGVQSEASANEKEKSGSAKTKRDEQPPKRSVVVTPREGSWGLKLQLEGLPPELAREGERVVADVVQRALAEKKIGAIKVAELPTNDVADIKGLRARASDAGLAVDFAFATLQHGVAQTPDDAGKGWVAHLPAKTLLGLAHAAALRAGVQDGWAPEPVGFSVADDVFTLRLKMWRVKAEPDFRLLEVVGRIVIEDGEVKVVNDDVREVGEGSGFTLDPVVIVTRAILLEEIRKGLSAVVPSEHSQAVGPAGRLKVTLERAVLQDDVIRLYGSVDLVRPLATRTQSEFESKS